MNTSCILSIAVLLFTSSRLLATNFTWDGGSAVDSNISTAANWNPDGAPPSNISTTDLIFAGGVRLLPNVSAAFSTNSVTFNNTAGSFRIGGSELSVGAGGITNNDADIQRFDNAVSFGLVAASTINTASGNIFFNSAVTLPTTTLTLNGGSGIVFGGTVSGTGTITKSGTGTLQINPTSTPIDADFNFNTGSTILNVSPTTQTFSSASTIAVNNTASLILSASAVLDGGQLTRAAGAGLFVQATFTIQNGADAMITGDFTDIVTSTVAITGAGSTFSATGAMTFAGGSALNVSAGGSASCGGFLSIATSSGNATATVDGAASSLNCGTVFLAAGNTGSLTFSNGATGSLGGLGIGNGAGAIGTLNILSGASVSAATGMGLANGSAGTGTVTINGTNSLLTIPGAFVSSMGFSSGTATLNIQSGGAFNNGTGTFTVGPTGTIAIAGGTFSTGGNLNLSGQFTRDAAGAFSIASGRTFTIQNGGDAIFTGAYTHSTASTVTVTGAGSTLSSIGAGAHLNFANGSALNVLAGGAASTALLTLGSGSNCTAVVDGSGSNLTATDAGVIGANGGIGTLTYRNSASGTLAGISLGSGGAGANGTLNVTGAGTIVFQGGASTMTIGGSVNSTGTLSVLNGGTFFGGTGLTTVNATGSIIINDGQYDPGGDVTLNGGQLTRAAETGVTDFNLAPGKIFTVQNGGDATFTGYYTHPNTAIINVTGVGSTFSAIGGGGISIEHGGTMNVTAGGSVSAEANIDVGFFTPGSMVVDGAGSSLTAVSGFSLIGAAGSTGSVTFRNGAAGAYADMAIAFSNSGSVGALTIESGADVTSSTILASTPAQANTSTITITGPGSTLTQNGAAAFGLGSSSASTATLTVSNGAAFTSGTGNFTVGATGTVNVNGGTLTVNGALTSSGTWNFTAGTLNLLAANNLTIGIGGLLGADLTLLSNRQLTVGGTTTIDATHTLTINGSVFRTGALVNNGTLDFQKGTLGITGVGGFTIGTGGALGASVFLGIGANLEVTNTATIASGATLALNGGTFTAGTLSNTGTLRANLGTAIAASGTNNGGGRIFIGDTLDISGAFANASGGRITLENGSGLLSGAGALDNSGVVTGDGTIAKPLINAATGEARADTGRTLNFTAAAQNSGQFNLFGGTLDFGSTLTNNASGFISGHGVLISAALANYGQMAFSGGDTDVRGDVTNATGARIVTSGGATTTFFDDVVHNGTEIRTSAGSNTVFFGAVSGAGPYTGTGTVYFEGDLRPGNSPASVLYEGDLVLGGTTTLTLEIGGLMLGAQYDHMNIGGTLVIDGALDLVLYNGFMPRFGDTFDLFDAGDMRGAFDTIDLPVLNGGLEWDATNLQSTGELRVVPEPAIGALLLSTLTLGAFRRRRR